MTHYSSVKWKKRDKYLKKKILKKAKNMFIKLMI